MRCICQGRIFSTAELDPVMKVLPDHNHPLIFDIIEVDIKNHKS